MPLLDHFHPPLYPRRHWESFHVTWAGAIADALNETLLPAGYFAEEHAHAGARIEIDVATFADESPAVQNGTVATQTYAPPAPPVVVPAAFPDEFEVRVYEAEGGARLVAALELVSPANKDRESHRRAFATKCAGYLAQGIAVIVVDVVTSRSGNLHADVLRLLNRPTDTGLPSGTELYAVAYRPVVRDGAEVIEVWPEPLAVGRELPTLPLALNAELCLPIDLESTYAAACARRRLE
ncbi:DUF4058 family protein [Gemmata sp. G18]|uniref:DUF4058 family protein n=1 Tax=Gemmata palustris TaxID=2822762 RepID=A0ABS5C2R8_9BACT|nr:DUF4058 family protein [Gemmata palustris]MBP3959967.1 DUF4058 family protein [Gemmata palustris]